MSDLNLIVLTGSLAVEPEVMQFASGAQMLRLLVTVRTEEPRRRIDVIPVVMWDPDATVVEAFTGSPVRGRGVWVAGSVQRRFWATGTGRTSQIEVVAHDATLKKEEQDG